jgi:hypothetical protein
MHVYIDAVARAALLRLGITTKELVVAVVCNTRAWHVSAAPAPRYTFVTIRSARIGAPSASVSFALSSRYESGILTGFVAKFRKQTSGRWLVRISRRVQFHICGGQAAAVPARHCPVCIMHGLA